MTHNVWRDFWKLVFVLLVVFLDKITEHSFIITCHVRNAVTVDKQEIAVPVYHEQALLPAVFQYVHKSLIHFLAHRYLSDTIL